MATLRELEYALAVANHGSVTAAARALHVSQPALSQALAALEHEFGGRLFSRNARGLTPTAAGRAALPAIEASVYQSQRARRLARRANSRESGELRIACAQSVTVGILPLALESWRRHHPGVTIHLEEHASANAIVEAVDSGRVDLGIGPAPTALGAARAVVLTVEELVIATPISDHLAQRETIAVEELADRSWVHYHPRHGLAQVVDSLCGQAGFTPTVTVRVEQTAAAPVLVGSGLGIGLVPMTILTPRSPVHTLHISPPQTRDLMAWTRSNDDSIADGFVTELTDVLKSHR